MTIPTQVNHPRFPVSDADIIYDDGEFSVAFSVWDDEDKAVGIRWNHSQGGEGSGIGFPNSRSRPCWFILPTFFGRVFLKGLKASSFENKNVKQIQKAIKILEAL